MYFVEKSKGLNILKSYDYFLLSLVLILTSIGFVALYSTTANIQGGSSLVKKQLISIVLGLILCIIISLIDYKDFKILGILMYAGSILLLILVLKIGIGKEEVGSNAWIQIGGFSIQPSEVAKIAFILVTSIFFERIFEDTGKNNYLLLVLFAVTPIGLVLLQPDFGTAFVYVFIFFIMAFVAGLPYKYIFSALGIAIASFPVLWFKFLKDYQKKRIITFFNPEFDPLDASWQTLTAKRAIGSGRIYGKGIFNGVQIKIVPKTETDFIFTVIGEEMGFIGTALVVVLVAAILLRCVYIAVNSRDKYGSFVVVGLTSMFLFHFFENIGMCIGITPVTGIPLPFASYGGSAMITNYMAIGFIISVSIRKRHPLFEGY